MLYSKTELKTNLKKMGQISAKCGVVCERGNNISWYYAVVNVNIDLNVSWAEFLFKLNEQKSAIDYITFVVGVPL